MSRSGQPGRVGQIQPERLDALRLLLARPVPVDLDQRCPDKGIYRLTVASAQPTSATYCEARHRQQEIAAIVYVVLDAVG